VTWEVLWEPTAVNTVAGYLKEDPGGVQALLQAADQLAEDPRPKGSSPWGSEYRRLRRGPWRILYRVDLETQTLHIEHVGLNPS
jgi:mRNA-degrading endonuclease RelE of RelBE toxin-antitoxin system